jgi:hypothetical protein
MNNNTMNNNKVENNNREYSVFTLVNKNGMALLMNNKGKYITLTDENGSSTFASLQLLANFVNKLERTEDKLVKILYPRNLAGTLKYTVADEWIANGYKTEKGAQLTKEYCELVKYINDTRAYLNTNNLICIAAHSQLANKADKELTNRAWKKIFELTNTTKSTYENKNKQVVNTKPEAPKFIKIDNNIAF